MKKIILLLLYATLVLAACNSGGEPKPVAKDSIHKNPADSFKSDPAKPPAQNSDEADRFSN